MNKNLLKICFVVALTMAAGSAYAATAISGATNIGGGTFSPSNKVTISANASSTNYAAQSKHLSGDRVMGTNNTDPKMYFSTLAVGSSTPDTASATVDFANTTGFGTL